MEDYLCSCACLELLCIYCELNVLVLYWSGACVWYSFFQGMLWAYAIVSTAHPPESAALPLVICLLYHLSLVGPHFHCLLPYSRLLCLGKYFHLVDILEYELHNLALM